MPGSPSHLAKRFFEVLTSKPLTDGEVATVRSWLTDDLGPLFFAQPPSDQRHGYQAALSVVSEGRTETEVVAAALLHDVGKRHASLGVMGRSIATMLTLMRLPLTRRMVAYRDHGFVGAKELDEAGAPRLAVEFALHHHGPRPDTIDMDTWAVLSAADEPSKARRNPVG